MWRCPAFRDSDYEPIVLFVKRSLTIRQCAVELLAAHVGRLVGVPCPEPYLVLANPRHIGRQGSKQVIAYGSVDLSTQGVTTPFRDVELMFQTLERLKYLDLAIVFDEWIANSVRQAGDVLFSASGKAVVFLDHERAMGQNVVVDEQVANWLADRVLQQLEKRERSLFLGRLRKAAESAYAATLAEPPRALQFDQDGVRVYRELTTWLAARLHHLDRLLSIRALPNQQYLPLWPVLLETMPGSRESITIAVIVRAQSGQSQVRQAIAPAALAAMFGPARQGMSILVAETVLGLQSKLDKGVPVEDATPPFEGIIVGGAREALAQDLNEVFDFAFRLCSAFSHSHFGVNEPADPLREVTAAFDEWADKIRDELARQNTARGVIDAFNFKLKVAERKSMRVGFYYSGFAANFGVLRPGHRASADTRALKVKIFDLEYIRRHHGLTTKTLALIVGVANANHLQIYSRQEVQTLGESVGYIESEARARQVEFQQYETPNCAAQHMRSSLQLPASALAY